MSQDLVLGLKTTNSVLLGGNTVTKVVELFLKNEDRY